MKIIRKKLISVVMTIIMAMSVLGNVDLTAKAATPITEISLTVEMPLMGGGTSVVVTCPDGANYTATALSDWKVGNSEVATVIEQGNDYGVTFDIIPKEGYVIDPNATVTINGSLEGVNLVGGPTDPAEFVEYITKSVILGTIDTVELTGVPQGAIGDTAELYTITSAEYTAEGRWSVYDSATDTWNDIDATHTFAQGNIYELHLNVYSQPGYLLSSEATLLLDGVETDCFDINSELNGSYVKTVAHTTEITEVTIAEESLPKAKVGDNYDGSKINIPVPAGSNYTAYGVWVEDDYYTVPSTFEDGKTYYLEVYAIPNGGYSFAETVILTVGDETFGNYSASLNYLYYSIRTSYAKNIDKVEVLNAPEVAVGDAINKGENGARTFALQVPEGANYTAYGMWCMTDGTEMTDDVFQDGKSYELYIDFEANEGYQFSESLIATINGVDMSYSGLSYEWAGVILVYSFKEVIHKVELSVVNTPVVGDKATEDSLKVPSDANYSIAYAAWIDKYSGQEATVFEDGHAYYLDVKLEPKEGYEFDYTPTILIDGEDCSDYGYSLATELYITASNVSFETVIPEIRLENVPTMKVGEKAQVDVKIPEGVNYELACAVWEVWNSKNNYYEEFTGVFEEGKAYRLYIDVMPKEGYRFDEEGTSIYINGELDSAAIAREDQALVSRYYSTNQKVIDRVEISIAKPVVGAHSSILPIITVPDGANYYVNTYHSNGWLKGKGLNYFYGYFQEGVNYGAVFELCAEDGYIFAEDLVVVVNGVRITGDSVWGLSDKTVSGMYFFNDQCVHTYSDWKDAGDGTHVKECTVCGHKVTENHTYTDASGTKCSVCGAAKVDGSPKTGDSSGVVNVFMLMMLCGLAVLNMQATKRRNNR